MKGIQGFHLVRYGIPADQKYLVGRFLNTYDQLVINANIVAYIPGALAAFIMQHARNKPYFIDPQTHAFQHDISSLESGSPANAGQIRRSIEKLLDAYGEPVQSVIRRERRPLLPRDFRDNSILRDFCQRVVDFQMTAISRQAEESSDAKYYDYIMRKKGVNGILFEPSLIVAPYFCMTTNTLSRWIELNIKFASYTRTISSKPVAVQIVVSKDLLVDDQTRAKLIEKYSSISPDRFLIWIDGFEEHTASRQELKFFVEFLKQLSSRAPTINLYGGFFSVALKRCGLVSDLAGVAHGLEYGESRELVPVGGGIPIAKFYHPAMHKRLHFRESLRVIQKQGGLRSSEAFYTKVCNCLECKNVIKSNPAVDFAEYGRSKAVSFIRHNQPVAVEYPLPETKEHCVKHYMWCKNREYGPSLTPNKILSDLIFVENLKGILEFDSIAYASAWKAILFNKNTSS